MTPSQNRDHRGALDWSPCLALGQYQFGYSTRLQKPSNCLGRYSRRRVGRETRRRASRTMTHNRTYVQPTAGPTMPPGNASALKLLPGTTQLTYSDPLACAELR